VYTRPFESASAARCWWGRGSTPGGSIFRRHLTLPVLRLTANRTCRSGLRTNPTASTIPLRASITGVLVMPVGSMFPQPGARPASISVLGTG
jgi:hypothetical protein